MNATNMSEFGVQYNGRPADASHGTFIPPEADAIQPASDCLWDRFEISPEAREIGDYLCALASRMSGEAIEYLDTIAIDMVFSTDRVLDAMDELQAAGKVRHFGVSNHTPGQINLLKKYVTQPLVANQLQLSITHAPISIMIR